MPERILIKGNEAIAEGAIRAGCRHYFCYPITPQSEIPEYLAKKFPKIGGVFLQAESEVSAINMVYGAAGAGARAMTSSSSPGISLKQEGISYIAGAQLPCVLANVMRGGPGLGNIAPAQGDYFQAVKGGGHGDYRLIVFAPSTAQEMMDFTMLAFELSDKYTNPAMILADGILGQMMEAIELRDPIDIESLPKKKWATTGTGPDRKPNIINSLFLDPYELEKLNKKLQKKYREIEKNETRHEMYKMDDAEIALVGYGTMARILKTVADDARKKGIKVGVIRPITLWPFPSEAIKKACKKIRKILVVELSAGQMVEDVRLAACGTGVPVEFYGKLGGVVPTPPEILRELEAIL